MRVSRKLSPISLDETQILGLVKYCQAQSDVLALYLYGSYGTPYQTALSDVDLAVLPLPGVRWDIQRELEISSGLAGLGGNEDINSVNLRQVPVTLQFKVLETGRLLFCRDQELLADFIAEVILRHADFSIDLAAFYRDYDAAVREEFL